MSIHCLIGERTPKVPAGLYPMFVMLKVAGDLKGGHLFKTKLFNF